MLDDSGNHHLFEKGCLVNSYCRVIVFLDLQALGF